MLPRDCGTRSRVNAVSRVQSALTRVGAGGWFRVVWFGSADQGRSALPVDGFEYSAQAFSERPLYLGFEFHTTNGSIGSSRMMSPTGGRF